MGEANDYWFENAWVLSRRDRFSRLSLPFAHYAPALADLNRWHGGGRILNNVWLIAGVSTLYFIAALSFGLRNLGQEETVCEVKSPVEYLVPTSPDLKEEV